MDFKTIAKKTYGSFDCLCEDIDWFVHNCLTAFSDRKITTAAKRLRKLVKDEIFNLISCAKCYENEFHHSDQSVTMLCDYPHLLLWVDYEDYGYWPSKLMHYENDGKLTLRYFGDNTKSTERPEKCLMLSKGIPQNSHGIGTGEQFDKAIQVIYIYSIKT